MAVEGQERHFFLKDREVRRMEVMSQQTHTIPFRAPQTSISPRARPILHRGSLPLPFESGVRNGGAQTESMFYVCRSGQTPPTPPVKKRRVSFQARIRVTLIPSAKEMEEKQRDSLWWNRKEIHSFHSSLVALIPMNTRPCILSLTPIIMREYDAEDGIAIAVAAS